MKAFNGRLAKGILFVVAAISGGCATERLHEQGIAAFDQREPENLSYRLDLRSRREAAVAHLISAADDAHANGKPEVAEANFRRVLMLEPGNERARHGIELLQADRQHADTTAKAQTAFNAKQYDFADQEVRRVLAEDPLYPAAVALANRIEQARGPVAAVPRLKTHDNRPVTLQFRDAQTKMVFEVLARETGLNFIFDKDVKSDGKTTIFVSQVPVEQAIDLILAQNQLARQILTENMVLIYPATPTKQKDYQDEIVHTFFLSNAAPKDAESMLKTVLSAKTMYVDERSGSITLRDTPEHVRMAEKLIASMDEPEPEVIMEVEVLEITHSLAQQLGIDYPTSATFAPTPTGAATSVGSTAAGLVLADIGRQSSKTISVSSLNVSVDLMKTVGNTNVLSSPRIRARNKEKAKILVGDRVPVITSGTSATTGGTYSTSSVQYLDVGLTLEVQPTIHNDGNVGIKVGLEVSSIANTINVPIGNGGNTLAYQISTRNANTMLELKDGETQVLAGLIQDSDTRSSNHIPGLGDLPVLGRLFGSNGIQKNKSEIVLAITPRIIRAQPRPSSDATEFWYGSESQIRTAPFNSTAAAVVDKTTGNTPLVPGGVSVASGGNVTGAALPTSSLHAAPTSIDAVSATPLPAPPPTSAAPVPETAGAAAAPPGDAATDAKPKVTLEGPDTAKVGDEIPVSVRLASTQGLGRVRAQVRFDAGALQLVSAEAGDLTPAGDSPKVDSRPGGVQLELAGNADAPVKGNGSVVDMRFKVLAARAALSVDTQVILVGEDGVAVAATAATPLKIAVTP
jgi:general secretion pathway protein D